MHTLKLFLLFIVNLSGSFSERLSVTSLDEFQRAKVERLRTIIEQDHRLEVHLQDDAYLLRFLAVKNFNLQEAREYIKDNLAWRKAEKIDSILDEDWLDYERRFPYNLSNFTKDGRPILYQPYGQWDISSEIDSGNYAKLVRYASAKMLEDADRKVRSSRKNTDVAQFYIIANLHGCIQCLQLSQEILQKSEAHYSAAALQTIHICSMLPPYLRMCFPSLHVPSWKRDQGNLLYSLEFGIHTSSSQADTTRSYRGTLRIVQIIFATLFLSGVILFLQIRNVSISCWTFLF